MSYTSDLVDPTLEEVCQALQMDDYLATFQREELTFSDLLLLNEEDLASLKLPLGPRKRLLCYLRDLEFRRAKLKQKVSDAKQGQLPQSVLFRIRSPIEMESSTPPSFLCFFSLFIITQQDGANIPAHDSTVGYTVGLAGTGQPSISYPVLEFHPAAFYALGSPTGI